MHNLKNHIVTLVILLTSISSYGYDSGSTGADGVFAPATNTVLSLPPNGIFNFTDVTIPAGVTVTFAKNANNTPVTMLASGNVTIDGIISLNSSNGQSAGGTGIPGEGGPGGFDGGRGGLKRTTGFSAGGNGQGPGGGEGAGIWTNGNANAGGASFGTEGSDGNPIINGQGEAGNTYGNEALLPLIGGSGGGGGEGGGNTAPGGGGGGGALLIAATGTVTVNGIISANGGAPGANFGNGQAGAGSGGAIRIVATIIDGQGQIVARPGDAAQGTAAGLGRIRLEADEMLRTTDTDPSYTFATPGLTLISNLPVLRIASVGGVSAPTNPSGFRDVVLPGTTTNPVTVEFATVNVPLGSTILLTAAPERGTASTATSSAISGSVNAGTASASINLPNGNSRLEARSTFTVTASLGADFSRYAQGEQVEKVQVGLNADGQQETTFVTVSGKEFTWSSESLAMQ
ncbi:MAG: hypothetical protein RIB78_11790 [Gammaproteobacteria bacterium]